MEKATETAFGLIDAQRGFMPASEGERLGLPGFAELPVPKGEEIIDPANRLIATFALYGLRTFTTQDWHPKQTAHFSEDPDFNTNWPVHCVAGTAGSALHPNIRPASDTVQFVKGTEPLKDGCDDTSYSGYYARVAGDNDLTLPDWIRQHGITTIVLGGLALDYCVGKTAIDLKTKLNLDVVVAVDATRGIDRKTGNPMLRKFVELGIRIANNEDVVAELDRGQQ